MALTLRMHAGEPSGAEEQAATPPPAPIAPGDPDESTQRRSAPAIPRARRCPACKQTFSGDSRFCPFDGTSLVDAPDWNPAADPLLGRTIDGRYEVLSVVGEGGMGIVYEVRHTSLGRLFAMKVLRRDIAKDSDLVARFVQEAKAAAAIGHPNIVAVSDFGSLELGSGEPALPYFVMEFLTGSSLAAMLRAEKTLRPERVGPLLVQCASALEAAHQAKIIHRDLKPDNIFIIKNGEHEFVKLLDFGVAKIAGGKRLTRIGMVFGTPHYMSPEQAEGKRIDARSDIYALGIIMYECFAGRVPFEADTYMGVLTKHMFAVPEPIERAAPDASALGAFGPIVMRCLSKRVDDRYASMADLASAIELAMENPKRAAAEGLMDERLPRDSLRLRDRESTPNRSSEPAPPQTSLSLGAKVVIALAAVVVPVAVALGFRAWRDSQAEPPPAAGVETAPSPTPTPTMAAAPAPRPEPPAVVSEAASATTTSTAKPDATTVPATAVSTPSARPTASAGRRRHAGEIVDPWSK